MRAINLFDDAALDAPSRGEIKAALRNMVRATAPMRVRRYRWCAYSDAAGRA